MKPLRQIKNFFIPNIRNSFHPYLLRTPALATVAASLLFAQIIFNVVTHSPSIFGMRPSIEGSELTELTNEIRDEHGLEQLRRSPRLERAAQAKAEDMLERDYWSHFAPDGTSPWSFIKEVNYSYRYAGENLAKSFQTNQGVIQGWMQSYDHRNNLLDSRFTEIGIATASGALGDENTTVVVAMYATPQPVSVHLGEGAVQGASDTSDRVTVPVSYTLTNPLMSLAALPILTQMAVLSATGLSVLFAMQHVVIQKKRLLWDAHIHPRPILQAVVLLGVAVLLIQTGFGVVG